MVRKYGENIPEQTPTYQPETNPNHQDNLDTVPSYGFENLPHDAVQWIKSKLRLIGLPLNNVSQIAYELKHPYYEDAAASADLNNGKLTIYKNLLNTPEVFHFQALVHEMAHEVDPWVSRNRQLYKDGKECNYAQNFSESIAKQSVYTGVFLNGYHSSLCRQLQEGKIDWQRFKTETFAILIELRFSNPNKLKLIQESQQRALEKNPQGYINMGNYFMYSSDKYVPILTDSLSEERTPTGIDRILISLIDGADSLDHLNEHIKQVRLGFPNERSPFVTLQNIGDKLINLINNPEDYQSSAITEIDQNIISNEVDSLGLPVKNLVIEINNTIPICQSNLNDKKLIIPEDIDHLPNSARLEVLTHLIAHSLDPWVMRNEIAYENQIDSDYAKNITETIARQCIETGIYLNYHHQSLSQELAQGQISWEFFRSETFAIMIQLRYTHPEVLQQVQESQHQKIKSSGKPDYYHPLMRDPQLDHTYPDGVDRMLINLIAAVQTPEELEIYLENIRRKFS